MHMIPIDSALTEYTDTNKLPFAELHRPWGLTYMKLISVSRITNTYVNIIRYTKGIQLPRHHHTGAVHAYTFSGAWRYLEYDWVAGPGSYVHEAPGTNHTLKIEEDTVALFVTQGANIYFDEKGEVSGWADAHTVAADVRAALERQGLAFDESIFKD